MNNLDNQNKNRFNSSLLTKKVLVIDDEKDIRDLLVDVLGDEGVETYSTVDGESALDFLRDNKVDCILSDVWMPKIDGITLIQEIRRLKNYQNTPIIMMSGHGTIESAVEATKKGVYDFIEKPLSIDRLILCVQNAINHYSLIQENQLLKKQNTDYVEPIGNSEVFIKQKTQALSLASLPDFSIIFGERGSGKHTYARFIHDNSLNQKEIYLRFDVDFDGEDFKNVDLFKNLADIEQEYQRATIVISGINQMQVNAQEKLLSHIKTNSNFRYILLSANDENLSFNLKKESIYQSLYLAPLRENLADLDELVRFYTDLITKQEQVNYRRFSLSAINLMMNYHWPNNVEELVYLIRKLLVLGGDTKIDDTEVGTYLTNQQYQNNLAQADSSDKINHMHQKIDFNNSLRGSRDQFEYQYLLYHLRKVKGSIAKLTKISGMERTSLHRKIKQLNINYKDF